MSHLIKLCLAFALAMCLIGCGPRLYTVVVDRPSLFYLRLNSPYKGPTWRFEHLDSFKATPEEPGTFTLNHKSWFPKVGQIALLTPDGREFVRKYYSLKEDTITIERSDWKQANPIIIDTIHGRLQIGMTRKQVRDTIGRPAESRASNSVWGKTETWVYYGPSKWMSIGSYSYQYSDPKLVRFRSGILTGWDE